MLNAIACVKMAFPILTANLTANLTAILTANLQKHN